MEVMSSIITFQDRDRHSNGLAFHEAEQLLHTHGKNVIEFKQPVVWYRLLFHNFVHPFNLLLFALAIISAATEDFVTMIIMLVMITLSVSLKFVQELKSDVAAQALMHMVESKAVVLRGYRAPDNRDPNWDDVQKMDSGTLYKYEIPMENVVPGDIVQLTVGDMVPGDVRLIESRDLFVSQSTLTGEVMPLEKKVMSDPDLVKEGFSLDHLNEQKAVISKVSRSWRDLVRSSISKLSAYFRGASKSEVNADPHTEADQLANVTKNSKLDRPDLCFMGTNVISGTAKAVVLKTGSSTLFGEIAKVLAKEKPPTAFYKGIKRVSHMFLVTMGIMVPAVFLITGLINHDWLQSFLFSIAIAVGLTPEMLPTIVSGNLAKSAVVMAKHKCIVKRLDSIINLGAMDVLCTDKTGTLTQDKVVLIMHVGPEGKKSCLPLELSFLNSYFQTGFKNLIDVAVIEFFSNRDAQNSTQNLEHDLVKNYKKVDEIPFDFVRRRMSVVLEHSPTNSHILVSKGAMEEMMAVCTHVAYHDPAAAPFWNSTLNEPQDSTVIAMTEEVIEKVHLCCESLNRDGLRVVAVAYKRLAHWSDKEFQAADECDMIFAGFVAFLDPPKESTAPAIKQLMAKGVTVKVLTGDTPLVCQKICKQVGLPVDMIVTTTDLVGLNDDQLFDLAVKATIFAKLTPMEKAKIVNILKRKYTVGFLGDGINDAAALREADVSCSVDTAVDVAKEAADFILMEKDLTVLVKAVILGRKTFGNTIKYIKMAVSSNFGNVFSVLIASAWLPFLPMQPIQLLIQNMLYDFSQIAIPWDRCDEDFLEKPRKWSASSIVRFMLCLGPLSSIFDIATFCFMWVYYDCRTSAKQHLFQTAWFVEGLLTQTCIVHMIRTDKIPFFQSTASKHLLYGTIIIMMIGISIPFLPIASVIEMQPLPGPFFAYLACSIIGYCVTSQIWKFIFIWAFQEWI